MVQNLSGVLKIYSPEVVLKKENLSNSEGSFLVLLIRTDNNQSSIQLYDEKGDFPFLIVRVPYLRSNIHSKTFCSTYGSEILELQGQLVPSLFFQKVQKI